jgi:hypothetical protein
METTSWHDPKTPEKTRGHYTSLQLQKKKLTTWQNPAKYQKIIDVFSKDFIFLQTDASGYGIGAYCFQLVDNVEQPVAFVSKSLTPLNTSGL